MARICGTCLRPPREGQEMRPIRLTEDDLEHTVTKEVGLYQACKECVDAHRLRYSEREQVPLETITNNMLC